MWPKRSSSPFIQENATAFAAVPVSQPYRKARLCVVASSATNICGTSATHISGHSPNVGTDRNSRTRRQQRQAEANQDRATHSSSFIAHNATSRTAIVPRPAKRGEG